MRRSLLALFLIVSVASAGCIEGAFDRTEPDAEAMALLEELAEFPEWRLETDHGTIRTILYTGWLPTTTGHISQLTERGFYDGTTVHRVVDDFVIQGGDPTGTGEGGSGPGGLSDNVPLETKESLDFGSGAVGLARWTDDTGDSQYFITEKPATHLSRPDESSLGSVTGKYALFAQVFEGMDVVRSIAQVETIPGLDRPVEDVLVRNVTLHAPPTDVDLLNLVPDVHIASTQGYSGDLEVPRVVATGHPAFVRFTTPSADQAPCTLEMFSVVDAQGDRRDVPWEGIGGDPCTFETWLTFNEPGAHIIDLGVDEIAINVHPWSDQYARFTGATATQTDKTEA